MRAEGQPVDQGGHHRGVLKKLGPSGKWEIRRHNGAAFFAPVRYHFEQQLRLVPGETEITQLIQNQQVHFFQVPLQFSQTVMILCFTQLSRECGRILEQDLITQATGFQPKCN